MAPLFETIKSFKDVQLTSDGVDTAGFLEASDGLVTMFDLFGSKVLGFVQSDIRSNITFARVFRTCYEVRLVSNSGRTREIRSFKHWRVIRPDTERPVWGLALTQHALKYMQNHPNDESHVCFKSVYDVVLKHHHARVVRGVVYVAIRAVPHRRDFYRQISSGEPAEKFNPELTQWLQALEEIIDRMKHFLEGGGYGKI